MQSSAGLLSDFDRALPPSRDLERSLRKITEHLARDLALPATSAPDWTDLEWKLARAVAAMHGISPLLARLLRWRGPDSWVRYLDEQRSHTAARHVRIDAFLSAFDAAACEAGIASIALKGAALHSLGVYRIGDRPMADVDLLVRPPDMLRAAGVLEPLGYRELGREWSEWVFSPKDDRPAAKLGEHSDNNVKIELHERICARLPWCITDISASIFPARPRPGLNAYSSTMALMKHLLLHAAGNMPTRTLRLLQLHDIAQLSLRMAPSDWHEMLNGTKDRCGLWWAFPPLELTSRYYPGAISPQILESFAARCPPFLTRISRGRSLYDVSLSYLWIEAFPGIAWSQSIGESLRFALSRLRPSREHVALRGRLVQTEAWSSQNPWSRLSQGRRVLRWMTSRPARVPTMHAIQAAIEQSQ
jgi:Uncharacterised nucleotidyltransferase